MESFKMIEQLLEKYLDTIEYSLVPGLKTSVEVFVNPSSKERTDMLNDKDSYPSGSLRFIADDKKKVVYAFASSTLHSDVWEKIGDGRSLYKEDSLLVGTLQKVGQVVKYESNFLYWDNPWNRLMKKDWSWADRYIPNLSKYLSKEDMR